MNHRTFVSIVTPAFNEAENLPTLLGRLRAVLDSEGLDWEWIVVDDHSADGTFEVVRVLADAEPRLCGLRLARNSGSHVALVCGLRQALGDCAVVMAADLQDPPETIPALLGAWRGGAQTVWAVRERREGEPRTTVGFARLYYWIMRRVVGVRSMPASGADFFLVDRCVMHALAQFGETNVSIMALLSWMGFRQAQIDYVKEARLRGRSGWSLEKKLNLVVDSVTSFSYVPIRGMSYLGFTFAVLGFLYAAFVIANYLTGRPTTGWSSLMVALLVLGGLQMLMLGVLGEYLWRALDESRRRPRYLIEDVVGAHASSTDTMTATSRRPR